MFSAVLLHLYATVSKSSFLGHPELSLGGKGMSPLLQEEKVPRPEMNKMRGSEDFRRRGRNAEVTTETEATFVLYEVRKESRREREPRMWGRSALIAR